MNITHIAIKNRTLVFSILVILIGFGISVFNTMTRDDMPPFLIRYLTIVSTFPGASPQRMEMLVSDKIRINLATCPLGDAPPSLNFFACRHRQFQCSPDRG
ncbi:efflux transporter, RND family, MFP subunit precursor [Desulfosarcina variabilis str. Montpellier]|uniref:hypothetical protein n=1 Tax=Desulfosarcina variabilis TaxID=2300 RepID=UPI003AFAB4DF